MHRGDPTRVGGRRGADRPLARREQRGLGSERVFRRQTPQSRGLGGPSRRRGEIDASRVKGVATSEPPHREPGPVRGSVQSQALGAVLRAGRVESAHLAEEGRDETLIDPNESDEQACDHGLFRSFWAARGSSQASSAFSMRRARSFEALRHSDTTSAAFIAPGGFLTMTTRSMPGGKSSAVARNASRTRRFARLRVTAPPILREAVMPRRAGPRSLRPATTSTNVRVATRAPPSWIRMNSARFRTRVARLTSDKPTPSNANGLFAGGSRGPCVHLWCRCACGSRGYGGGSCCGAEMCASWAGLASSGRSQPRRGDSVKSA